MKLIIIEGGDNLGKNALIKNICNHLNYDNILIRHFGKPDLSEGDSHYFQDQCFKKEGDLLNVIDSLETDHYTYFDNIVIWNRSHIGEYVYAQMFRGEDASFLKKYILDYEENYLSLLDVYLVTLTASPEFFLNKEDGNSFSKNLKEKTRELELFTEAHNFSTIKNKSIFKVDQNGKFKSKQDIFNKVINFLKIK